MGQCFCVALAQLKSSLLEHQRGMAEEEEGDDERKERWEKDEEKEEEEDEGESKPSSSGRFLCTDNGKGTTETKKLSANPRHTRKIYTCVVPLIDRLDYVLPICFLACLVLPSM